MFISSVCVNLNSHVIGQLERVMRTDLLTLVKLCICILCQAAAISVFILSHKASPKRNYWCQNYTLLFRHSRRNNLIFNRVIFGKGMKLEIELSFAMTREDTGRNGSHFLKRLHFLLLLTYRPREGLLRTFVWGRCRKRVVRGKKNNLQANKTCK